MIDKLETYVLGFGGAANHTQCFLHVINLVEKSLIHQFNMKKKDTDAVLEGMEEPVEELRWEQENMLDEDEAEDMVEVDNNKGWIDEIQMLTAAEHNKWLAIILPLKLVLIKVRFKFSLLLTSMLKK